MFTYYGGRNVNVTLQNLLTVPVSSCISLFLVQSRLPELFVCYQAGKRKRKKFTKFLKTVLCQAFVTVLDLITNQQLCINSTNACARTFKKKKKKKVYVYVCTCARSCVCLKEYTCEHVRVCVCGELALSWRERASERG